MLPWDGGGRPVQGRLRPVSGISTKSLTVTLAALQYYHTQYSLTIELKVQLQEVCVHACRASLGYMSTFEDVEAFSLFLERTYTDRTVEA